MDYSTLTELPCIVSHDMIANMTFIEMNLQQWGAFRTGQRKKEKNTFSQKNWILKHFFSKRTGAVDNTAFVVEAGAMYSMCSTCICCCLVKKSMACHTPFGQTASDTWATYRKTEGRRFPHSDAFFGEIVSTTWKLEIFLDERAKVIYFLQWFV